MKKWLDDIYHEMDVGPEIADLQRDMFGNLWGICLLKALFLGTCLDTGGCRGDDFGLAESQLQTGVQVFFQPQHL